ncbi:MAG: nicotinamide-nucleotide amidase [Halovenus sp.]|jgi:nicotinamide-nucleotide amidase
MTDRSPVERVGDRLRETGVMVAVAESSTGGLVCSWLTDVPGSSDYFDRGVVSYSNAAKVEVLGVNSATLNEHGAVSEQTAREMAVGVRDLAGTAWGVSTTGVAGPGGGTARTPVGTVYIGVARRNGDGSAVSAERYEFDGTRDACKRQFTRQALTDLLDAVESDR